MKDMDITFEQWLTVKRALEVAADVYRKDANTSAGVPRISEQFRRQARDCETLIAELSRAGID